ncbi:MAG: hypothetical protein WA996_02815 [Candidatus Promineifilaceae bacterium]
MNNPHHPGGAVDLGIERMTVSELALTRVKPHACAERTGAERMWSLAMIASVLW